MRLPPTGSDGALRSAQRESLPLIFSSSFIAALWPLDWFSRATRLSAAGRANLRKSTCAHAASGTLKILFGERVLRAFVLPVN
jgi:hypothetical protein